MPVTKGALSPEEEADLTEAQAEMQRGEFATDAEVEAVLAKLVCEAALSKTRAPTNRRSAWIHCPAIPQGAAHVEARLRAIVALLQVQSLVGRKTSIPGVRRVLLTPYPYLIDYYVSADEIVIQKFRHTARKPSPG